MPWTLYRFIAKEVLKVLLLCSAVLVLLISFAAAIKPLGDGLLGPVALIKFILYFMPTTLQFALPFAGAFASTLVLSRMTSDNEIVACSASGLSYRSLLMPTAVIGLVLTVLLFVLGNWVVPRFYEAAEQLVQRDFLRIVVSKVQRREPVDELASRNMILYADAADDSQPPPVIPDSQYQPNKLIMLRNVVLGQLDPAGRLRSDSTAEEADMLLYEVEGQTWVTVRLSNVTYFDEEQGRLNYVRSWSSPAIRIPNPFRDHPRFMSMGQLLALRQNPTRSDRLANDRQQLILEMSSQLLLEESLGLWQQGSAVHLEAPGGEAYDIRAARAQRQGDNLQLSDVRIDHFWQGMIRRHLKAQAATVRVDKSDPAAQPRLEIELNHALINDSSTGQRAERRSLLLPRGRLDEPALAQFSQLTVAQLIDRASQAPFGELETIRQHSASAQLQLRKLHRKIAAQLHQRVATAVGCMFTLLLGAVLSMKLRGSAPLVVYFWSFLLAILSVVIIRSGENVCDDVNQPLALGLSVIWGGVLLLIVAIVLNYRQLARN